MNPFEHHVLLSKPTDLLLTSNQRFYPMYRQQHRLYEVDKDSVHVNYDMPDNNIEVDKLELSAYEYDVHDVVQDSDSDDM